MQITIDSQDLLDILLEAGIQTVDAKALILDILVLQENAKNPPPAKKEQLPPAKKTEPQQQARLQPINTTRLAKEVHGDIVNEQDNSLTTFEEEEEGDDKPDEKRTITRVQGKSVGPRPKFDGFGGDSTGVLRR